MQEMQTMWVWSLGRGDPLEEEMATRFSIFAWKIPWTVCVCSGTLVTLFDPVDCSPPGSSAHGILQVIILESVACALLQGIFLTQGLNLCLLRLLHCRQILYCWVTYSITKKFRFSLGSILVTKYKYLSKIRLRVQCIINLQLRNTDCYLPMHSDSF